MLDQLFETSAEDLPRWQQSLSDRFRAGGTDAAAGFDGVVEHHPIVKRGALRFRQQVALVRGDAGMIQGVERSVELRLGGTKSVECGGFGRE